MVDVNSSLDIAEVLTLYIIFNMSLLKQGMRSCRPDTESWNKFLTPKPGSTPHITGATPLFFPLLSMLVFSKPTSSKGLH